jgi:hypothetical protein
LKHLQKHEKFLIVQCDKNLGPAIIEKDTYITRALADHLCQQQTYRQISQTAAAKTATNISNAIKEWIKTNKASLTTTELKFLRYHLNNNETPFPAFYMTMKVHKTPWSTRPIVSCSGSLLYAIGVWVDRKLQIIAQKQKSYFKNSRSLKDDITSLRLPPNAQLFTADAVSMYTNIH